MNQLFYRRDCAGGMVCLGVAGVPSRDGSRGEISEYSVKSAWRLFGFLRSSVAKYSYMTTLTYPGEFETDGKKVKRHLDRFLKRFMTWNASACWFLEFQKRGAPHFHILHTGYTPKGAIAVDWAWSTGEWHAIKTMTRVERLRHGHDGAIGYALKYAMKSDQKQVPPGYENVGRFWGVRGDRRIRRVTSRVVGPGLGEGVAVCAEALAGALRACENQEGGIDIENMDSGEGFYFRPSEKGESFLSLEAFKKAEIALAKAVARTGVDVTNEGEFYSDDHETLLLHKKSGMQKA